MSGDPAAHLLVVDDDERIRGLLQKFLMRGGFLVSVARDAAQARRLLAGLEFDLIVLDLTDPDTPAARLYTPEFFRLARRALAPGGAITLHLGSPVYQPERVRELLADLSSVFPIVRPMGVFVPLYGAYWGLAVVSDSLDPCALAPGLVDERLAQRAIGDLQLYNASMHHALFALPNFYRALLPA